MSLFRSVHFFFIALLLPVLAPAEGPDNDSNKSNCFGLYTLPDRNGVHFMEAEEASMQTLYLCFSKYSLQEYGIDMWQIAFERTSGVEIMYPRIPYPHWMYGDHLDFTVHPHFLPMSDFIVLAEIDVYVISKDPQCIYPAMPAESMVRESLSVSSTLPDNAQFWLAAKPRASYDQDPMFVFNPFTGVRTEPATWGQVKRIFR